MPTFKSQRCRQAGRWDRYNAAPDAIKRRTASREAASIAGPSPEYPPLAPLHGDWLGGCINGQTVILRLMRDTRHRCDQWAAEVEGEVIAQAAGLTALWALLKERFAPAPSKRSLRSMRDGYTAQDEADAAEFEWRSPLDALA